MTSLYATRVSQGLCGKCGEKPDSGSLCATCKEKTRLKKLASRAKRQVDACIQCGEDSGGKSRCHRCATRAKESRKRTQDRKKAAGICQNSGCNNSAMPDKTVCTACSQKASKSSLDRYYRNKEAGVCRYCGKDSGGRARCDDCASDFAEYAQDWYRERKAAGLCANCPTKLPKDSVTVLCKTCRRQKCKTSKKRWDQLRQQAIEAYGGPVCVGCGEDSEDILELDHTDGGGNKHRREIGQGNTYLWLKQQGYPAGYRVLCPTCNKKAHKKVPLPNEV